MKLINVLFFLFFFQCVLFSILAQDNNLPLSFDNKNTSFDEVSKFVFRGDRYFYDESYKDFVKIQKKGYNNIFNFFNAELYYNRPNKISNFDKSGIDTVPTAYSIKLQVNYPFGRNWYGMVYANWRGYQYFSYDGKNKNRNSDINVTGELESSLYGFMIGYRTDWISGGLMFNTLSKGINKYDQKGLDGLKNEYLYTYQNRYNEVNQRFGESGIKTGDNNSLSLLAYSPKLNSGLIIAPNYNKIDLNYAFLTNATGRIAPYSQIVTRIDLISESMIHFLKPDYKSFFSYMVKSNYKDKNLKKYENTVSSADYEFSKHIVPAFTNDTLAIKLIGFGISLDYDHTNNRLAMFSGYFRIIIFKVKYEYNNMKTFMPEANRLYRQSIWLTIGTVFS